MINKPFQKGIAAAQTVVHIFMLGFIFYKAAYLGQAILAYLLFAAVQYAIVTSYNDNVKASVLRDIMLTGLSLFVLFGARHLVGHRFIAQDDMFVPAVPFFNNDHLFTWGIGFYLLTRFMGVGYGLCLTQVKSKAA